jgi:hypothetical protein
MVAALALGAPAPIDRNEPSCLDGVVAEVRRPPVDEGRLAAQEPQHGEDSPVLVRGVGQA